MHLKKWEKNGVLITNFSNMKTIKNFILYIILIICLLIIFYLSYEVYSFLINKYISPCVITSPTDFDCLNIKNILILIILSIITTILIGKYIIIEFKKLILK